MVFLYLICRSLLPQSFLFALPPLTIVFGVPELARLSTPDGLAFCAVIVYAYLFLKGRRALFMLFSPVMVGIRTDLILFILPFLALLFFFADRSRKWPIAISALVSVAIYFSILSYWSNPGWATTFYHTFVRILTHPVSIPPALTTRDYFNVIVRHTITLLTNKAFALYCGVVACSFYLSWKKAGTLSIVSVITYPSQLLGLVSFIYIVSHFLLFPNAWDRFFAAQYLLGTLALLSMITEIATNPSRLNKSVHTDRITAPPRSDFIDG
jgi:hypothetical protein